MTDDNIRSGNFPPDSSADSEIAALLASLDSTVDSPAMPGEVAARLDEVIAVESRARRTAPGRNVRRLVVAWGAAAAAVVAVVAGVSVVADNIGIGPSSSSDSSVAADSKALGTTPESAGQARVAPVVRADHLAQDSRRLLVSAPAAGRVRVPDTADGRSCPAAREPRPDRQVLAVTYAGPDGDSEAILILTTRPPRTATVFACDGTRLQQVPLD